jgi:hypothetical protein
MLRVVSRDSRQKPPRPLLAWTVGSTPVNHCKFLLVERIASRLGGTMLTVLAEHIEALPTQAR